MSGQIRWSKGIEKNSLWGDYYIKNGETSVLIYLIIGSKKILTGMFVL